MTESPKLNIILLGDNAVGKSYLAARFTRKKYMHTITVHVDLLSSKISIGNKTWNILLRDTTGRDLSRHLIKHTEIKKADGVLLVYDVTNIASFSGLPTWLFDIKEENEKAPVIIVGNKIDKANRKVSTEQVKEFARDNELDIMESSAETGENVDEIFERLIRKMLLSKAEYETESSLESSRIILHNPNHDEKRKKTCY